MTIMRLFPFTKIVCSFSFCLFLLGNNANGQDTVLTFEQAITIALENNFDIRIAGNDLSKQELYNHAGEAGMLPDINVDAAYNRANNSTNQKYSNGDQVDRNNARSENLNASLSLGWTIFDGTKMFSTKRRLNELSTQSAISLKIQMEDVYLEVIRAYFEIAREQQLLKSIKEEIQLGRERVSIAERRLSNGSGSKLDVLHAKTDLNSRLSAEMTQISLIKSLSIDLNKLMARSLETNFVVEDSIKLVFSGSIEEIKNKSKESNHFRSYYRKQLLISNLALKESIADRWPRIQLNGSYNFSNAENEAGFIRTNKNQGFSYGITAGLPLFNGFRISKNVKAARLDVLNARLELEQAELAIDADIIKAFQEYKDQLAILKLEEENILSAREILIISQERFRSGLSGIIELKEVQRSYEEAMTRLVDARFEAKLSESNLMRLSGLLIQ
ncbi:MAG: TolC family protein [Bacteroidetes bacterium]|nr:MAG: TolC family protein [Bacteroidota bacterium]